MEKSGMNFGNDSSPSAQPVQRGVESAGAALHSTIDKMAEPARSTVDRLSSAAHETVLVCTVSYANLSLIVPRCH